MSRVAQQPVPSPADTRLRALLEELEAERAITFFATSLINQSTVDEVLWDVAKNCVGRLGFVDCVVYWLDTERGVLVQKAAHGPKNPADFDILHPLEIPLGKGIVGTVAFSGRAELIGDTSQDPRYITDDEARLSEIAVPILAEGRVLGVIDAEHPKKNFFGPRHLKILSTIASVCAQKIRQVEVQQAYRQAERELAETHQRVAETKLLALRMQMNPHFVFNSLSAINRFVLENDGELASTYLTKFSRLIRQVLDNTRTEWVPLRDELKALVIYVELEQLRCATPFELRIDVAPGLDPDVARVPPLLVQPYVDNAIWHGLLPKKDGPAVLRLAARREGERVVLDIEDNGIGRAASVAAPQSSLVGRRSHGSVLAEERLRLVNEMYDADARLDVTDLVHPDGSAAGTRVSFSLRKTLNR